MARRENDFYETAPWQVDALIDNVQELARGLVLCPCVGDGSLMRRLQDRLPALAFVTNDLDATKDADFHLDMTHADSWNCIVRAVGARPDWVIENYPFNLEHLMVPYALQAARLGSIAMARVSFAEPTKNRGPWLAANPYQKRITLERHSFTGNGSTDSATTDWLVWAKFALTGPFGISAYGYRDGTKFRIMLAASGVPEDGQR